ncbi:E3 ubiquitin-protein ligase MBR2-like [Carica papaya]|uniref:E3 ubiquitin-protein ligase MBR2-like n=1 Tax=Carica papaya TaxID=3649 RepID=UPI000B8CB66C|nr:E3 ubiquitin-protein ligase MBR2-like [Carica papaya]
MQNQLNRSNSLRRSYEVGHGIDVNNRGSNQHNVALNVASSNTETIPIFIGESSNSTRNQNYFSVQQLLNRDEYDHMRNGHFAFRGAGSSNFPRDVDMNETPEGNGVSGYHDWGRELSLRPFNSGGLGSAISPSGTPVISSGIPGYVVEENNVREVLSSDGGRLSRKRGAPEYVLGELFTGDGSTYGQRAGDHPSEQLASNGLAYLNHGRLNSTGSWNNHLMNASHSASSTVIFGVDLQAASSSPQLNSRLVAGSPLVLGQALGPHQASSAARQMHIFERNTRLRTENQQDVVPEASSAQTVGNPIRLSYQLDFVHPCDQVLNEISEPQVPANETLAAQLPIVETQNLAKSLQLSQLCDEVTWSGGALSAASPATHVTNGGSGVHQEGTQMNQARLTVPSDEGTSTNRAEVSPNANKANGNTNTTISSNAASSSRNVSGPSVEVPPAPNNYSQPTMAEEDVERNTNTVNQPEGRRGGMRGPIPLGAPAVARRTEAPTSDGNRSSSPPPLRMRAIRGPPGVFDFPPPFQFLTDAERRRTAIREVFAMMSGIPYISNSDHEEDEEDYRPEMRLDVDDMNYEELLELEAQIRYINNGLAESIILENLDLRIYHSTSPESEICCICQDDYEEENKIGKLDCGHEFHSSCVTTWLMMNNTCPICKRKGLDVADH